MAQLKINDLQLQYKTHKNDGFDLSVKSLNIKNGEFFTLLGESGCGKTTLLKVIAGLEIPDRGDVWVNDQWICSIPTEKRGIGMVFQNSLLFPHMNVLKNICFGLKMTRML